MGRLVEVVGDGCCGGWPRTSAIWRAAWGGWVADTPALGHSFGAFLVL